MQSTAAESASDDEAGSATDDPAGEAESEVVAPGPGEVFVLARRGLERFHRCGMRFTREPTVLVVAELGEGVLERLKDEPNLVVVEG